MTLFKKQTIPNSVRVALAIRHGCRPGDSVVIRCHYCPATGTAWWYQPNPKKTTTWIHFRDLEMDHVTAEFLGGVTSEENIVLACRTCNRSKGTRSTPRLK